MAVVSRMLLHLHMSLLVLVLVLLLLLTVLTNHKLRGRIHVGEGLLESIHRVGHGILLDARRAHHPCRWSSRALQCRIHRSCISISSTGLWSASDRAIAERREIEVTKIEEVCEVVFRARDHWRPPRSGVSVHRKLAQEYSIRRRCWVATADFAVVEGDVCMGGDRRNPTG